MSRVARRVKDERVLKLIRRYLEAGMMSEGIVSARTEGTPQGGPLSPLLSNILLTDLDRELERRGHRFCRYADDCNVYVKSERAGQHAMEAMTDYLEKKLKLWVKQRIKGPLFLIAVGSRIERLTPACFHVECIAPSLTIQTTGR